MRVPLFLQKLVLPKTGGALKDAKLTRQQKKEINRTRKMAAACFAAVAATVAAADIALTSVGFGFAATVLSVGAIAVTPIGITALAVAALALAIFAVLTISEAHQTHHKYTLR